MMIEEYYAMVYSLVYQCIPSWQSIICQNDQNDQKVNIEQRSVRVQSGHIVRLWSRVKCIYTKLLS